MALLHPFHRTVLLAALICAPARAATLRTGTTDAGGRRTASASYTMDGTIAPIAGFAVVSPTEQVLRHGYVGQLVDPVGLSVEATPASIPEGSTAQLSGSAINDDETLEPLSGSDIAWTAPSDPIISISGAGVATAGAVYQDTMANVTGAYQSVSASGTLLVLDTDPDNFGSYAGDGLPDDWQVEFFGFDNPDAGPLVDLFGTGQNNFFKYVAGLNPTNPASIFKFHIALVPGQPEQKRLLYEPLATGRTYSISYSTNLVAGAWPALTTGSVPQTNAQQVVVTDLLAVEPHKQYRMTISLP